MKNVLVLAVSVFFLWSCNNSTNNTSQTTSAAQEEGTHNDHQHTEASESIELNKGEKWLVNEEMKPFIIKGSELVESYINENNTDYKNLAEQVKEQNSQLIKSCTMQGKSHDELHKWLHPHLDLVKSLSNETDETKAQEIVNKIHHSYHDYHNYFQ